MSRKKPTIAEFLSFVNKNQKKEKVEIRAGNVDKRQTIVWGEEEIKALFFIITRHGYNSTRSQVSKISKKIDSKNIEVSDELFHTGKA